jgi:hypothetical protein
MPGGRTLDVPLSRKVIISSENSSSAPLSLWPSRDNVSEFMNPLLAYFRRGVTVWPMLCLAVGISRAHGQSADPVDFSSQIRPILSSRCFACHGPDEGSRKAKLRLDLRDEAIKERKGGRPIVPGDSAHSELFHRISTQDPDDLMPPAEAGQPLKETEIALFKRWIDEGAAYTPHWAFAKPARPPVPAVKKAEWPLNPADHFILQKLEKSGLGPASRADRYALIRRLSLDLTGLPPTPAEIETFASDKRPDAYERLADQLLTSPAYGERWARVWLDLARYADSAGYGSDPLRLNIWPWRNWVIDALNRNLPFDQFTIEQIAGDLLPNPTQEQLIATAFNRNTMTNTEGGTDDEEFRVAAVKDRANTTAQIWMGLTLGCAQCHTHKYDPITQKEYYQFYAFFNQTEDNDQPDEKPTLPLPTSAERQKTEKLKGQIADLERERNQVTPAFQADFTAWESVQMKGIPWTQLAPVQVKSAAGSLLVALPDNSVLAGGALPETDTYTVRVQHGLTNATAFRLEVLPDISLPNNGAGRAVDSGKFVLNEFQVAVRSPKTEAPRARFVRVELPGSRRVLSLAEIQIFTSVENAAPKGKASQSSTSKEAVATRAIDGRTDGELEAGSITLTEAEENPWWEVDLGAETPLEEIVVWNRIDRGLGTRLTDFKIVALDGERKKVWDKSVGSAPNPVVNFRVPEEKTLKLQNASATFSEKDLDVAKAIDGNTEGKSGWSIGGRTGAIYAASFEFKDAALGEPGSTLIFSLVQRYGTNHTLGRFRISATTQPLPIRETPETIKQILSVASAERTEEQKKDLLNYFRAFAPALARVNEQLAALRKDLDGVKPVALPVLREVAQDKRRKTRFLNKGNFLDPGDDVQPTVLAAFHQMSEKAPTNRLGLAQWLVSRENPLTARVAVNRLWARLFGVGIVETEEDFGTQGRLPSHPQLLDWLAVEFMDSNWDMKAMLKLMVMSATYQQSSRLTPELLQSDPLNRLYSRGPRLRLDAETLRDQALALSGLVSRKIGGPSVYPMQPEGLWRAAFNGERTWATSKGEDRYRRGLYTFWRRTVPYPSMATFDAPSRETCTVRRIHTNTPLQAFVTMNDPVYVEASQALGRRIAREGGSTVADRIRYALLLCLARPPSGDEVRVLADHYEKELAHYRQHEGEAKKLATEPLGPLPEGANAAEAAAWTSVANVLLNLDGVLTKG